MQKNILLFLFFAASLCAKAQNWVFHVGGGLATQTSHHRAVGAFKVGVSYEHEFNGMWSIAPGVQFYAKGRKDKDKTVPIMGDDGQQLVDDNGNLVYGLMGRSTAANYLQLPVMVNYYLRTAPSRYVVLSAGPYVACGVAGKVKTKGDAAREGAEKLYYEGKTFDEPGTHRFDAGVRAMVGYHLASGLIVGVEADFGLTHFDTHGRRNMSALINLSYRLNR